MTDNKEDHFSMPSFLKEVPSYTATKTWSRCSKSEEENLATIKRLTEALEYISDMYGKTHMAATQSDLGEVARRALEKERN